MKNRFITISILILIFIAIIFVYNYYFKSDQQRVGIILSGNNDDEECLSVKKGILLAQYIIGKESNNDLTFIFSESGVNAQEAAVAARDLIRKKKVEAIIAHVSVEALIAIDAVCEKEKVILLCPAMSDPKLSGIGKYFFRLCPSDDYEGQVMAECIAKYQNWEGMNIFNRVLIITDKSGYSEEVKKAFTKKYYELNGHVVGVLNNYEEINSEEFKRIYKNEMRQQEFLAIYIIGRSLTTAKSLLSLYEEPFFDPYAEKVFITTKAFNEKLRKSASRYFIPRGLDKYTVVCPLVTDFERSNANKKKSVFTINYFKRYNSYPDVQAALAYDSVMLIRDSFEREQNFSGDLYHDISTLDSWEGVTGSISFNVLHDSENLTLYGYDGKNLLTLKEIREKGRYPFYIESCK